MEQQTCKTCKHFIQHYAFHNGHIFRVYCGHCTYPKPKRKQPHTKACDNYLPGEPDEAAFVNKEYLSKRLLEYVLTLELLPEIRDTP